MLLEEAEVCRDWSPVVPGGRQQGTPGRHSGDVGWGGGAPIPLLAVHPLPCVQDYPVASPLPGPRADCSLPGAVGPPGET